MPANLLPKYYGSENKEDGGFRVGARIRNGDHFGTVKYSGPVHGYEGSWLGIEWDDPSRGKHDGSLDDVHYFKTSKPGAGSFVRPTKLAQTTTCADAIRKCYGDLEVGSF